MQKISGLTETIPLTIPRAQFEILVNLYERPNLLNEFTIKTEAQAKEKAMRKRYVESVAWRLHDMMLCSINRKTKVVMITEAGAAVLEGRQPTLHSLIRQDTKG